MGWSIGYDEDWKRDIGYGVPAVCDHPKCNADIDRGLSYVCGSEPYGGEHGCGLHFCEEHRDYVRIGVGNDARFVQLCERCRDDQDPFEKKPDTREWVEWKLKDESWEQWRKENPTEVAEMGDVPPRRSHVMSDVFDLDDFKRMPGDPGYDPVMDAPLGELAKRDRGVRDVLIASGLDALQRTFYCPDCGISHFGECSP